MSKPKLTVVAPAYNEEEVIGRFYEAASEVLASLESRYDYKLLFVLDRCEDGTLAILKDIAARDSHVQIVTLSSRFGHQMSLLAGVDHAADADAIVMMDSDLQHPPALIPQLVAAYERGNDVVFTVRRFSDETGALRRILNRVFYRSLNYLSHTEVKENAADFRLISRRVAEIVRIQIRERNMFLRGLFSWVGFNQTAVEFLSNDRAGGKSKYSLPRIFGLGMAGMLSFSTKPLKISIYVGMALAMMGFAFGVFAVYEYFSLNALPSGWTSLVTLLLLFSGFQLIFIGIIGAYIGGIYEEVKARPHYIVDEKINI
jgi:polyisoprenyl-phosphate glycosyltransferase